MEVLMAIKKLSLEDRFWSKVDRREDSECWPWIAFRDVNGYGRFRLTRTDDVMLAHRVSWLLSIGSIPQGMDLLHGCNNPACVNPAHLRTGTAKENMADRKAIGRYYIGENNPVAKLSDASVAAIRSEPGSNRQMAARFGVTRQHISKIRSGQRRMAA
jgi:hypothetical protein